jgi:hypothetical protein
MSGGERMKRFLSCFLVTFLGLFPGVALDVTTPKAAWGQSAGEPAPNNHSVPGSVIIFPKWIAGSVTDTDGSIKPKTEVEVSAVCPVDIAGTNACPLHLPVIVKGKWVCPPQAGQPANFCGEFDFLVQNLTVNGTVRLFPPDPPCPEGFLILWVVNNVIGQIPISFNGLIGDAVIRESDGSFVTAYNGHTVRSPQFSFTPTSPLQGALFFDGVNYDMESSLLDTTVRYDGDNVHTFITLLSLNVSVGTTDNPSNVVSYTFYSADEQQFSSNDTFVCWKQVDIGDLGMTAANVGSVKGQVTISNSGFVFPFPLVGLILTVETIPNTTFTRGYAYAPYYDPGGTNPFGFFCEAPLQCF